MSRIRSKNTGIDNIMEGILNEVGAKFEKYPRIPGRPDFVIRSKRVAIFCDGDFWHGYNYMKKGKKLNGVYWEKKITGNIARDKITTNRLRAEGWIVLRFWEHEILKKSDSCAKRIERRVHAASRISD